MNTFNITPQNLKSSESAMRNNLRQRIRGDMVRELVAEAEKRLQAKQERISALRKMLVALDCAKLTAASSIAFSNNISRPMLIAGMGSLTEEDYRATLANDLAELEQIKNALNIYTELFGGAKE